MTMTDRELFAQALCDAWAREYDKELACSTETAECSMSHYKKMSKILGFNVLPRGRRGLLGKRLLIAAIAAALLLAGCTAVIFREEIKTMLEKVTDTFIWASYDESMHSVGKKIDEVYTMAYVPDGYKMTYERSDPMRVVYRYEDSSGNRIEFTQLLANGTSYMFDNEMENAKTIELGDRLVYHRASQEYFYYLWNDGEYAVKLMSTEDLSYEELENIFNGISK